MLDEFCGMSLNVCESRFVRGGRIGNGGSISVDIIELADDPPNGTF